MNFRSDKHLTIQKWNFSFDSNYYDFKFFDNIFFYFDQMLYFFQKNLNQRFFTQRKSCVGKYLMNSRYVGRSDHHLNTNVRVVHDVPGRKYFQTLTFYINIFNFNKKKKFRNLFVET